MNAHDLTPAQRDALLVVATGVPSIGARITSRRSAVATANTAPLLNRATADRLIELGLIEVRAYPSWRVLTTAGEQVGNALQAAR